MKSAGSKFDGGWAKLNPAVTGAAFLGWTLPASIPVSGFDGNSLVRETIHNINLASSSFSSSSSSSSYVCHFLQWCVSVCVCVCVCVNRVLAYADDPSRRFMTLSCPSYWSELPTKQTGKFIGSMFDELSHFPKGPAMTDEFWLLMVTWHVGLFLTLLLGQIGWQGKKAGYFK